MRFPIFATLLAAATATTSFSPLPTFTSTIISSTCSSSSSRVYYGNSTSSELDSIIYETDSVTKQDTLTMLQTSCSNDECYVTTILNTIETVTATVDGILTTYVTASPFTVIYNDHTTSTHSSIAVASDTTSKTSYYASETGQFSSSKVSSIAPATNQESVTVPTKTSSHIGFSALTSAIESDSETTIGETVTLPHTTVLTLTSCVDHKCQITSVTTGVTVVTTTVDGVKTVYTTYCPFSGEVTSTMVAAQSSDVNASHLTTGVNAKTTLASIATTLSSASAAASSIVIESSKETKIPTQTSSNIRFSSLTSVTESDSETTIGETVTLPHTTVLTLTSCVDHKCQITSVTTGVTVVTTTVDGVKTVYTTYCPFSGEATSTMVAAQSSDANASHLTTGINAKTTLASITTTLPSASASASSQLDPVSLTTAVAQDSTVKPNVTTAPTASIPSVSTSVQTTIITITSCQEDKCSASPITTGVAYLTSTVSGTETIFTTFCPLTGQKVSSVETETATPASSSKTTESFSISATGSTAVSSSSTKTLNSNAAGQSTINVITNNILTQSKTLVASSAVSSNTASAAVATAFVSSYQGGAGRAVPVALALPLVYLFL